MMLMLMMLPSIPLPSAWPCTGVRTSGGRPPCPGGRACAKHKAGAAAAAAIQDTPVRNICRHVPAHACESTQLVRQTEKQDNALPKREKRIFSSLSLSLSAFFTSLCVTLAASLTRRPCDTIADLRERILRFCKKENNQTHKEVAGQG